MNPADLSGMSHADLVRLRDTAPPDEQSELAPYEHRAFAREYTMQNPVTGTLGLVGAIPAYQMAKMAGLMSARTRPSWQQVGQGFVGVGEGLVGKLRELGR